MGVLNILRARTHENNIRRVLLLLSRTDEDTALKDFHSIFVLFSFILVSFIHFIFISFYFCSIFIFVLLLPLQF